MNLTQDPGIGYTRRPARYSLTQSNSPISGIHERSRAKYRDRWENIGRLDANITLGSGKCSTYGYGWDVRVLDMVFIFVFIVKIAMGD